MKNILFITMLLGVGYSQSVHLEIQNVNLTEGTLDIYMENDVDIYALQLVFSGLSEISITPGEIVPDSWFFESANHDYEHGGAELLGFDLTLSEPISGGEGILATVTFMDAIYNLEICIPLQYNCEYGYDEETCFLNLDPSDDYTASDNNPVFSDASGNSIPVTIGDCFVNDDNWIYGCTYDTATNYNPDATFDDRSCEFMWGDVNHDGQLTIQDLILIVNEILNF